jgi:hypothetical protein
MKKNIIILILLVIIVGGGYLYIRKYLWNTHAPVVVNINSTTTSSQVITTSTTTPVIRNISRTSGPIGLVIELEGDNLAGFEGDLDAWIENSKGEKAFLPGMGSIPRVDQTIRVKIESKLCKTNNSYSGLTCKEYLNITPGIYNIYTSPWGIDSNKVQFTVVAGELMNLTVYIQDRELSIKNTDCSITKKVTYQIPITLARADASLEILFTDELSAYGVYKSISIVNGVAKIMLESNMTPAGYPIGSLSSCQSSHLMSVLKNTLTQYNSIKSVELYSPAQKNKIEF